MTRHLSELTQFEHRHPKRSYRFGRIIDETFRLIQRLFRQVRIPYAIIGGYAASVWGVERATLDIDVLVGGRPSQFTSLIDLGRPVSPTAPTGIFLT